MNLGEGFVLAAFSAGRYANAVQKTTFSRHGLQVYRQDMTSSFVLDLDEGGFARAYRGWRYLFFSDGPNSHTEERIREQLGYSGQWSKRESTIDVDLTLDDHVCPRIAEYSHLVPKHASTWNLHFVSVIAAAYPSITEPILVCPAPNLEPTLGEDDPHSVEGLLSGKWIVLGGKNGLRIRIDSGLNTKKQLRVESAAEVLEMDAWQRSF